MQEQVQMKRMPVEDYDTYVILKQVAPRPFKDGFRANGYELVNEIAMPKGTDILSLLLNVAKREKQKRKA